MGKHPGSFLQGSWVPRWRTSPGRCLFPPQSRSPKHPGIRKPRSAGQWTHTRDLHCPRHRTETENHYLCLFFHHLFKYVFLLETFYTCSSKFTKCQFKRTWELKKKIPFFVLSWSVFFSPSKWSYMNPTSMTFGLLEAICETFEPNVSIISLKNNKQLRAMTRTVWARKDLPPIIYSGSVLFRIFIMIQNVKNKNILVA